MSSVRLEAIGPRGEACIIVRTVDLAGADLAGAGAAVSHRLATGERLVPADVGGAFRTLDGARTFRLRDPAQAGAHSRSLLLEAVRGHGPASASAPGAGKPSRPPKL